MGKQCVVEEADPMLVEGDKTGEAVDEALDEEGVMNFYNYKYYIELI